MGLESSDEYIYLPFFYRKERIDRATAGIETYTESGWVNASYAEYMTIFDVLSRYALPSLTGEFRPAAALLPSVYRSGIDGGFLDRDAAFFDEHFSEVAEVCSALGRSVPGSCDAEFEFDLFDFLPLRMRLWRSDEEFPAELGFLWDACTLDHMYFETTQFAERFVTQAITGEVLKKI